jgi:hypothetical protein
VTVPAVVWIVVGLGTTLALVAMLVGLVRHVVLLARTVSRLREEIGPAVGGISAGTDRASIRVSELRSSRGKGRSS